DHDGDLGLDIGIAGLADGRDAPLFQPDVGLDDAPVVEDQRIGDHGVDRALAVGDLALAHAVADHLAAAELHLLALAPEILLHLGRGGGWGGGAGAPQGGPEHVGRGGGFDLQGLFNPLPAAGGAGGAGAGRASALASGWFWKGGPGLWRGWGWRPRAGGRR